MNEREDCIQIPEVTLLDLPPPLGHFSDRDRGKGDQYIIGLKRFPEQTFTVNFQPDPGPDQVYEFEGFVVRRRHARSVTKVWLRNLTAPARPVYVLNIPERGRRLAFVDTRQAAADARHVPASASTHAAHFVSASRRSGNLSARL